jgi:spoIIIJ-associated protein
MNIEEYLSKLCYFLNLDEDNVEVDVDDQEDSIRIMLTIDDPSAQRIIGTNGQTLRALQSLLRITFLDDLRDKRLVLDINGFLKQKEEELVARALDLADEVLETGQPKTLYDLNSFERYLVHSSIAENEDYAEVRTYSTTVGGNRYLTICLAEDLPPEQELKE